MGVNETDRKLLDICIKKTDFGAIIDEIIHHSLKHQIIVSGLDEMMYYSGESLEKLGIIQNIFTFESNKYNIPIISPDDVQDKAKYYYLAARFHGFKSSKSYAGYQTVCAKVGKPYTPVQDAFAEIARQSTLDIIKPYFKEQRNINISFVILSGLNNCDSLQEMLTSFKEYVLPDKDIEVIVVINESSDSSAEVALKALGSKYNFKIINVPENVGIAGGFNEGIDVSCGKYICLLQDDIYFTQPNWHRELEYYLEKYPNIGVLGGFRAGFYYKKDTENCLEVAYDGAGSSGLGKCNWDFLAKYLVKAHSTNCMLQMFRNGIHRYDENYLPNGIEDHAFCFGIRKKGYDIYVTDVGIIHDLHSVTRGVKNDNNLKYLYRNLSRAYHYEKFIADFNDLLSDLPEGVSISQINFDYLEKNVEVLPRDYVHNINKSTEKVYW